MSLAAIGLRESLRSDALLSAAELSLLLPGDADANLAWIEDAVQPEGIAPSGIRLYRWDTVARAFGLTTRQVEHELLTVTEVAALLRVPESRIYQLTSDKRIPFVKLGHRTVRFDRAAILDWTRSQAVQHLDPGPLPRPRSSIRSVRRAKQPDAFAIAPVDWTTST